MLAYAKMYVLEPGESEQVESATADPIGLKVGIVYEAETEVNIFSELLICDSTFKECIL